MAAQLRIPKEHSQRFIDFISLPYEIKDVLFDALNSADLELNPRLLTNYVYSKLIDIGKDKVFNIVQVYLNLINAKNSFDVSVDEFIPILEEGLIKTGVSELKPDDSILNDFKKLLLSGSKIAIKSKVLDLITENSRTYLGAKVYQDIRPSFDENGSLIGSGIINKLKLITRKGGRETEEIFISLDNNDLNELSNEIKKAQDAVKLITTTFTNANFIEP